MNSFLRWPGGKRSLVPNIREAFGGPTGRYVEPFLGGGAVFFARRTAGDLTGHVLLSDVNPRLMITYAGVRGCLDAVIAELRTFPWDADFLADPTPPYLRYREQFNTITLTENNVHRIAALLIWLNRACFNGLYRENQKGGFNAHVGDKAPMIDLDNLRACSAALQGVTLRFQSYTDSFAGLAALQRREPRDDTQVYVDPPYWPVSDTAKFTQYSKGGFNGADQIRLAALCCDSGARVVASNAGLPPVRALYEGHGFEIREVQVRRAINVDPTKRGAVPEYVMVRGPLKSACLIDHASDRTPVFVPTVPSEDPSMPSAPPAVPAFPIVKHLTGTLKNGVDVDLGQFTLIIGPNGSGKTACVTVLELAITGKMSGVLNRDEIAATGQNAWMISEQSDDGFVTCKATLSTGATSIFSNGKVVGGYTNALPLRDVIAALSGSVDATRRWLLGVACTASHDDVAARFPENIRQAYALAVASRHHINAIDVLLAIQAETKKAASSATKEAKRLVESSAQRAMGLGMQPTDDQIDQARALAQHTPSTSMRSTPLPDLAKAQAQCQQAISAFETARAQHDGLATQITDEAKTAASKIPGLQALNGAVEFHRGWLARNPTTPAIGCMCCGNTTVAFDIDAWNSRAQAVGGALQVMHTHAQAATTLERMRQTMEQTRQIALAEVKRLETVQAEYTRIDAENATMPWVDPAASRAAKDAIETYATLQAARSSWAAVEADRARAFDLQGQAAQADAMHGECTRVLGVLLDDAVAAFEAKVNRFLPEKYRFGLELRGKDGEPRCRFGFVVNLPQGPVLRPILSGAEEATLWVALAAATWRNDSGGPGILIPPERDFDAVNAVEVLRALRAGILSAGLPFQVVWTKAVPAGETFTVPEGWHVITRGGAKASVEGKAKRTRKAKTEDVKAEDVKAEDAPGNAPGAAQDGPPAATPVGVPPLGAHIGYCLAVDSEGDVCNQPVYLSPSGEVCDGGHGGWEYRKTPAEHPPKDFTVPARPARPVHENNGVSSSSYVLE